jgi:hypothetical protein
MCPVVDVLTICLPKTVAFRYPGRLRAVPMVQSFLHVLSSRCWSGLNWRYPGTFPSLLVPLRRRIDYTALFLSNPILAPAFSSVASDSWGVQKCLIFLLHFIAVYLILVNQVLEFADRC